MVFWTDAGFFFTSFKRERNPVTNVPCALCYNQYVNSLAFVSEEQSFCPHSDDKVNVIVGSLIGRAGAV